MGGGVDALALEVVDGGIDGLRFGTHGTDGRGAAIDTLVLIDALLHLVEELLVAMQLDIDGSTHHATVVHVALPVVARDDATLTELIGTGQKRILLGAGDLGEHESHEPAARGMA